MDERHTTYSINRQLLVAVLLCIYSVEYVQAQLSKKDSIRLQNILSGKEKLQLDTETQQAISEGTFINFDKPVGKMRMSSTPLIITKDFSEYLQIDDTIKNNRIALKDLPPAVFMRYGLDKPLPKPRMMISPFITQPTRSATRNEAPPTGVGADFNALISTLVSKRFRQIEHNKKHATAWKSYNNLPTLEVHNKQRKFRTEHPNAILPLVVSTDTTKIKPFPKDSLSKDSLRTINSH